MLLSECKCGSSVMTIKTNDQDKEKIKIIKSRITDLPDIKELRIRRRKYKCEDKKCKMRPIITLEMPIDTIELLLDIIIDRNEEITNLKIIKNPIVTPIEIQDTLITNIDDVIEKLDDTAEELRALKDKIDSTNTTEGEID